MPKLKVPGESLKTKNRLKKISKSHKLHVPSKDIQRDTETKKVKRKLNGTVSSATKFYKIFGASEDEEEWVGFQPEDLVEKPDSMETGHTSRPESPLSFASSCSSPLPARTGVNIRKRGTRCMECEACMRLDDCGKCTNCRDKPKFGGPGSRKQACIYRKCTNLVRDIPLKYKRTSDHLYQPSAKRSLREDSKRGGLVPTSPLKPRRIASFSLKSKDNSKPLAQLYWPDAPSANGFPVYSFSASTFDMCTRCGSSGFERIIYCQYCSQPYHWFCAGIAETTSTFVCSLCVTCSICNKPDECTQCNGCKLWFHKNCLLGHTSESQTEENEMWKCVECTKCISCHRNTPNKMEVYGSFLSSLLAPDPSWCDGYCYCSDCFLLKAKGNSCPICGECYLDNDFDSKMVQCNKCDLWIHSHCEGMTDEEYEILSDLPDSVEYTCRLCMAKRLSKEEPSWRVAVNQFKEESFNKILSMMKTSLGHLWHNDISVSSPVVTVATFVRNINNQFNKCSKGIETGSHKHRLLYLSQQNYNKEIEELFPWFSPEAFTDPQESETSPTDIPSLQPNTKEWPGTVLHDHFYLSCDDHMCKAIVKEENINEANGLESFNKENDSRTCLLCTLKGDQPPTDAGRLLPCGSIDEWAHINCALWSAEVYEDDNGVLCCVHSAVARGQRLRCDSCHLFGATVGCCHSSCSSNFHYMCARRKQCVFLNNKEVYCHQHNSLGPKEQRVLENDMRVDHCVLIHTDNYRAGRKITKTIPPQSLKVIFGSLCIHSLGSLTSLSDTVNPQLLIPHNFSSSCYFWNTLNPSQRISYTLTITANPPEDEPLPPAPPSIHVEASSPEDIDWPCVTTEVGGTGLWSSVSSMAPVVLNPSLVQTAYALLKASDGFPVAEALRTFRIPKKVQTQPLNEEQKQNIANRVPVESIEPIESYCLDHWRKNEPTNMSGILYEITSSTGSTWKGSNLNDLWQSLLNELQSTRQKLDLPYIPYLCDSAPRQFGLDQPFVMQLLEQLPNQEKCCRHTFKYHQPATLSSWQQTRAVINLTGSARTEGYSGMRSEPDMFSFLMSQWRPDPPSVDTEALDIAVIQAESQGRDTRHQHQNDVPVAMRYRACQRTYRENVGVFVSRIHGLGLFCLEEIESGDMVIEYAGTVIRSILTDYRERYYESRGIGCYMFRIDNDDVVDATMSGNMARFINHSCEPNCYSKVVAVDGQKKIIIFALRKIVPGEELTYDYKFPIEEAKIPCKCGAVRCRKTLN